MPTPSKKCTAPIVAIGLGVGLFGVVTGFLAERFLGGRDAAAQADALESPVVAQPEMILSELARLRREQLNANEAINARLDALFAQMQEDA